MQPFTTHTGKLVPLDRANVDTDQIIPKNFMKNIGKTGLGEHAFNDWRYAADGSPDPAFPLNQEPYRGGSVLLARNNFGCGSSREHAVWAIAQAGIRAIVAPRKETPDGALPGFADIFRNNSIKNGLLPIELSSEEVDALFASAGANPGVKATIDLAAQEIRVPAPAPLRFRFEIDAASKNQLINGLDDIALTLSQEARISAFESRHNTQLYAA